jgi:hypothetical protein
MGKVSVAFDEVSLRLQLDHLDQLQAREKVGAFASASLLADIRRFIFDDHPRSLIRDIIASGRPNCSR